MIRSGSDPSEWKYVNRDNNPADDWSKGVKLDTMITKDRWLRAPEFLWKDQTHWPQLEKVPVLKDKDPEVRKEAQIYVTSERCNALETLILRHSSWWKLKCSIGWLLRYKEYLCDRVWRKKSDSGASHNTVEPMKKLGRLTVKELDQAKNVILRHVQPRRVEDAFSF